MSLPKSARAKIEAAPRYGARTADFLEIVGIETFNSLADAAATLRLAVDASTTPDRER